MDKNVNKKKITLVISQLSGGGAERVTCNLANYLNENGYKVDVVTLSDSDKSYKVDKGVKEICLLKKNERSNFIVNNLFRFVRMKRYVKKHEDVSCYVVMLSIPSFMLTSLKRHIRGKIIVSERVNPTSYHLLDKIMMRYAIRRSDGLVVQTREISDFYKKVRNKIVIPNALNKDVKLPEREQVEKRIVAVGRLEKQKNYPMLIEAFKIFNKSHPDYLLEIYGQGSQEKTLRRMVDRCGLNDKIMFMDYVIDVSEKIADATCFVMTSNYEGISNALVEAMCVGLPCVATDSDGGGARDLIINDENGFIVKKNDVDDLVNKMSLIVSEEKIAKKVGNSAKRLREILVYEKIYARWLSFIKQTVEGGVHE